MAKPRRKTATIHHLPHRNTRAALRDKSYRFIDRDPDLEFICNAITDSGTPIPAIQQSISKASGGAASVSHTTIYNWLDGKVRRPQNYTLHWVAFALGYERIWQKVI